MIPNVIDISSFGEPIFLIGKRVVLHTKTRQEYNHPFRSKGHYILYKCLDAKDVYSVNRYGKNGKSELFDYSRNLSKIISSLNSVGAGSWVWGDRYIRFSADFLFYLQLLQK